MSTPQRAACVIGYPAKHSRSPMLHGYWIKQHGLDADYRAEEIAPEHIEAFLLDLAGIAEHLLFRCIYGTDHCQLHQRHHRIWKQDRRSERPIGLG